MAPEGDWQYPGEVTTTLTERDVYEQMMREAIFHRAY